LASRAKAITPAANGAAAEVPLCDDVHVLLMSDVTWTIFEHEKKSFYYSIRFWIFDKYIKKKENEKRVGPFKMAWKCRRRKIFVHVEKYLQTYSFNDHAIIDTVAGHPRRSEAAVYQTGRLYRRDRFCFARVKWWHFHVSSLGTARATRSRNHFGPRT